ncbi:prolipoprotein diacylglyceryl transferase [Horticoccus luteus]|uniref:Phosphatidylglycerol--prolipoprotein diacylglyceryl transferase n=1 Tax=Horticoccus luteus TaxID=2862869 RepID=A0A8F9TWP5_9BACT|nr:prolipoprotein diacylglyceryl transferase [Horticoccus luteus]QYM80521.1 prolipoprotein diacylglyceryl transferase [Horticoccus luteus]
MMFAYWVHHWDPFVVRFTGNFGIRYYGLAYLLGFLAAAWLLVRYAKAGRSAVPAAKVGDFMVALVIGVLVGGRLGYFLLYQSGDLFTHPLALFRVWEGGMASHGGFIGVALALVWYARRERVSFFHLADLVVSAAPLGLFFGRIANFINGELWGKISYVSWAVIFPESAAPGTPLNLIPPRHPSQLYEALLEGVLLFVLVQLRFWRSKITQLTPGRLCGEFLIAYAVVRAIGEIFREPDVGVSLVFGLSRGTFYSIFLVVGGVAMIAYSLRHRRPQAK